jgi:hypothetical protein
VSNHVARTFSSAVTPIIERHVKESITKTLIPAYLQESSGMHQELSREIHNEILNLKKEIVTWQSEALRGQEAIIRDLEQTVRSMSEQLKYLTMNINTNAPQVSTQHLMHHRASPGITQSPQTTLPAHLRGSTIPPTNYAAGAPSFTAAANPTWYSSSLPSSHNQLLQQQLPPPPPPAPVTQQQHAAVSNEGHKEDWDETYLGVLATQDPRQLRELLARSIPETVMPLNGNGPLSQAVVLTLIHRVRLWFPCICYRN